MQKSCIKPDENNRGCEVRKKLKAPYICEDYKSLKEEQTEHCESCRLLNCTYLITALD